MNKLIAPIVAKYTAQYIEGLDSDSLNVGIFGGSIELSNLRLKRSALAELDLPVDVVRGSLGKLVIKIPWTNLSGQAVVAKVDELLLLVKPKTFGTRVQYVRITPKSTKRGDSAVRTLGGIQLFGEKDRVIPISAVYTVGNNKKTKHANLVADGVWAQEEAWEGTSRDSVLVELKTTDCVRGYRVRTAGGAEGSDVDAWEVEGALADHNEATWHTLHNEAAGAYAMSSSRWKWSEIIRDLAKPDLDKLQSEVLSSKRTQLEAHDELLKQQEAALQENSKAKSSSFTERLQETIVSNLEIDIKSIHIRFEDDVTSPDDVYTMGICLNSLKVFSTTESWERSFISSIGDMVHKSVGVEEFGVYMDHSKVLTHELPHEKWQNLMLDGLSRRHTYLLTPLSLQTHLKMLTLKGKKNVGGSIPAIDLSIDSQELGLGVNRAQYTSLLKVLQFVQSYGVLAKYNEYRPSVPVLLRPKSWWHFMRRCIVQSIRHNRKTTDKTRNGKLKLAEEYIQAYKHMQGVAWLEKLSPDSPKYKKFQRVLDSYEYWLPIEELKKFRKDAQEQLSVGRKKYEKLEESKAKRVAEKKKQQSWSDWMSGVKVEDDHDTSDQLLEIDAAAREQLMASIGWNEDDTDDDDVPDQANTVVSLNVSALKIQLNETRKVPIGEVQFLGTAISLSMCKDSMATTLSLQDFRVSDATSEDAIVSVREAGKALLNINYEMPPQDHSADSALKVDGLGLDICFSPSWLSRVVTLFSVPPGVSLSSLEAATTAALADFGSGATRGLMLALEEKKSIAVDVTIEGPRLYVPYSTGRMEVNSGTLTLVTDVDKQRKARILSGEGIKAEDYYDRLRCGLTGINTKFWVEGAEGGPLDFVSDVSLGLQVDNCLTPDAHDKANVVLKGDVGSVDVSVSHVLLLDLLSAVESVTAWVSNPSGTTRNEAEVACIWNGTVQALPPVFLHRAGDESEDKEVAVTEKSASDTTWTTYQAQYLPHAYKLVLTLDDEAPLVVKIGKMTTIEEEDDTIIIELPQGNMGQSAVVQLRMKVEEGNRQDLFEKMRESRWELSAHAHTKEINKSKYASGDKLVQDFKEESLNIPNTKVNLICCLDVPHVFLNMNRNDGTPISKIGISNFALNFQQRQKDMCARLSLANFSMVNMQRATGAEVVFLGLVPETNDVASQEGKCIEFVYEAAEKGSPLPFRAEGTGTRIELNCGSLVLDSERSTLPPLLGYLTAFGNVQTTTRHAVTYEEKKAPVRKAVEKKSGWFGAVQKKESEPATEVNITMKGFETSFRNDNELVFSTQARRSEIGLRMIPEESLVFTAQLGNFVLKYHTKEEGEKYCELISCNEDESTMKVKYTQDYTVSLSPKVPVYSASASVVLGKCSIVYLQRTIVQLQRYFDVGYIMKDMPASQVLTVAADAAKGAALAAQQMASKAAEDRQKSLTLMQINLEVSRPTLIVPYSAKSADNAQFVMGTLTFKTSLLEKPEAKAWVEVMDIRLVNTSLKVNDAEMEKHGNKSIIDDWSLICTGERGVLDPDTLLPAMKLKSDIGDMKINLTKAQYEALMVILNANVLDTWLDETLAVVSAVQAQPVAQDSPAEAKTEQPVHEDPNAHTKKGVALHFDLCFRHLSFRMDVDKKDNVFVEPMPLMAANLNGLTLMYKQLNNGGSSAQVGLDFVGVTDSRVEASPFANQLFSFGSENAEANEAAKKLLVMTDDTTKQDVHINLLTSQVTLLPELLGGLMNFFVSEVNAEFERERRDKLRDLLSVAEARGDTYLITTPWWTLTEDLYLGPKHRLLAKVEIEDNSRVVIDANGHKVFLTGNCKCTSALQDPFDVQEYCIAVAQNVTLILRNANVYCQRSLNDYVLPGSGRVVLDPSSQLHTPATALIPEPAPPTAKQTSLTVNIPDGVTVLMPEKPSVLHSRMLVLIVDGRAVVSNGLEGPGSSVVTFSSDNISVFPTKLGGDGSGGHEPIHNVLGPAKVNFTLQSRVYEGKEEKELFMDGQNFSFRLSYNDIKSANLLQAYVTKHLLTPAIETEVPTQPIVMYHPEVYTVHPTEVTPGQQQQVKKASIVPSFTEIKMNIDTLSLLIVDDQHGYDRSLVRFRLLTTPGNPYAVKCNLTQEVFLDGSSCVQGGLVVNTTLEFFNGGNMNWEPIIEPYQCTIDVSQRSALGATESKLQLDSEEDLSLCVSSEMVQRMVHVSGEWMIDMQRSNEEVATTRPKQYVVNNQTGLTVSLRGTFVEGGGVLDMTSKPIEFDDDKGGDVNLSVDFGTSGMRPLKLMESEIHQVFRFPATLRQKERNVYAITDKRKGQLHMTLGSRYLVSNRTKVPIEIRVEDEVIPIPAFVEGSRAHEVAIPLWALQDAKNPGISVRSADPRHVDYHWSTCGASPLLPVMDAGSQALESGALLCGWIGRGENLDSSSIAFAYTRTVRDTQCFKEGSHLHVLVIQAPILLENTLPTPIEVAFHHSNRVQRGLKLGPGDKEEVLTVTLDEDLSISFEVLAPECGQYFSPSEPKRVQSASDKRNHCNTEHSISINDKSSGRKMQLHLDVKCVGTTRAKREICLYVPYWVVNMTGCSCFFMKDHGGDIITRGLINKTKSGSGRAPPLLFSGCLSDPFDGKLSVCHESSPKQWGQAFQYDVVGVSGETRVCDSKYEYRYGVAIELAPGHFSRSKMVKLLPRWVFVNNSEVSIEVQRYGGIAKVYHPGDEDDNPPFPIEHPKDRDEQMTIQLMGEEYKNYSASACITFSQLGTHHMVMRHKVLPQKVIDCQVTQLGSTNYVVFKESSAPPLRFVNNTFNHLTVVEVPDGAKLGERDLVTLLPPFSITPFYPVRKSGKAPKVWMVHRPSPHSHPDLLEEVEIQIGAREYYGRHEHRQRMGTFTGTRGDFAVHMDLGQDSLLCVVEHRTMRRRSTVIGKLSSSVLAVNTSLGVSMISSLGVVRREMAYLYLGGMTMEAKQKLETMDFSISIQTLQLDNQLYSSSFATIMTSDTVGRVKRAGTNDIKRDAFALNLIDYSTRRGGMTTMTSFSFLLQELELTIDDIFLFELLGYLLSLGATEDTERNIESEMNTAIDYRLEFQEELHGGVGSGKFYAGELIFNPIKMIITYRAEDDVNPTNPLLKTAMSTLSMSVTNIEESPLKLSALIVRPANGKVSDVSDVIYAHYRNCALRAVFNIIGALDFLGNPVGLIGGIGDGVSDLFYEPINGITKSPKDFAEGLGRGMGSLGRHAAYGVLGTVGGITTSISSTVAVLSLDREWGKERRRRQRKKATGIGSGMVQAGTAVKDGFFDGFSGLVLKPIEVCWPSFVFFLFQM